MPDKRRIRNNNFAHVVYRGFDEELMEHVTIPRNGTGIISESAAKRLLSDFPGQFEDLGPYVERPEITEAPNVVETGKLTKPARAPRRKAGQP